MTETCDRCKRAVGAEAVALGWPVSVPTPKGDPGEDIQYICPTCYGEEAFCPEGHVLPIGSDDCHCGAE